MAGGRGVERPRAATGERGGPAQAEVAPDAAPREKPLPAPVDLDAVDRDRDVHGIVVRAADGSPVAGALLEVVTYPGRRTSTLDHGAYCQRVPGPSTRSAADGTFALRLALGERVSLCAQAPGLAPLELARLQAGERVRVELRPGARVLVQVRAPDGTPAAGVDLRLFRTDQFDVMFERHGKTDIEGKYLFDGLPGNVEARLDPRHERYGTVSWVPVRTPEPGAETVVRFAFPAGRRITGRVTDAATGAPVVRAQVGRSWTLDLPVATDSDGRYVLEGWTGRGTDDLHVVADGYGRIRKAVGRASEIDFALEPGDSARGTVVDALGRPVPAARVTAIGSRHKSMEQETSCRAADTAEDGTFLLEGLRRDLPHTLLVIAKGHARYLLDFDPRPEGAGTIELGEIRLPAAQTIAGRVVDGSGAPVPRAPITLTGFNPDRGRLTGREPPRYFFYADAEERLTDDLGRFRFPDQPPGTFELKATPPGAQPVSRTIELLPGADATGIVLELAAGEPFVVTVVDDRGAPLDDAYVVVYVGKVSLQGRTGPDGTARFVVPGTVTRVSAQVAEGDFMEDAAEPSDRGGVRLVLAKAAHVSGKLVDPDGNPLERGRIEARRGGKVVATAWTDAEGTFDLRMHEGSVVDVVLRGMQQGMSAIDSGRFEAEIRGVVAGTRDLVLQARGIAQGLTLLLRVTYPDGTAVPGHWVAVEGHDGKGLRTDAHGRLKVDGLAAKETLVFATAPRDKPEFTSSAPQRILPGGQEVALVLRAAKTISGKVVGADGRPPGTALVVASRGDKERFPASTDEDGSFRISVPDDGSVWSLEALGKTDQTTRRARIANVAAGTNGVVLTLE